MSRKPLKKLNEFIDLDVENTSKYKISNVSEQSGRLKALKGKGNIAKLVHNYLTNRESTTGIASPLDYSRATSKTEEQRNFLPFEQERDHLGRLNAGTNIDSSATASINKAPHARKLRVEVSNLVSPKFTKSQRYSSLTKLDSMKSPSGNSRTEYVDTGEYTSEGTVLKLPSLYEFVRDKDEGSMKRYYQNNPPLVYAGGSHANYSNILSRNSSPQLKDLLIQEIEAKSSRTLRNTYNSSPYLSSDLTVPPAKDRYINTKHTRVHPHSTTNSMSGNGSSSFLSPRVKSFWERNESQNSVPPVGYYEGLRSSFYDHHSNTKNGNPEKNKSEKSSNEHNHSKIIEAENCQIEIQTYDVGIGIGNSRSSNISILTKPSEQGNPEETSRKEKYNKLRKKYNTQKCVSKVKRNEDVIFKNLNPHYAIPKRSINEQQKSRSIEGSIEKFPPSERSTVKNVVNISKQLSREEVSFMKNYNRRFKDIVHKGTRRGVGELEMNIEFMKKYKSITNDKHTLYMLLPPARDERRDMALPATRRLQFKNEVQHALNLVTEDAHHPTKLILT